MINKVDLQNAVDYLYKVTNSNILETGKENNLALKILHKSVNEGSEDQKATLANHREKIINIIKN